MDFSKLKENASSAVHKTGDVLKKAEKEAVNKFTDTVNEATSDAIKEIGKSIGDSSSKIIKKIGNTANDTLKIINDAIEPYSNIAIEKAKELVPIVSESAETMKAELENTKKQIQEEGFSTVAMETTKNVVVKACNMPIVYVDREEFLRKTFGKSEYIEQIIQYGPQKVFTVDAIRQKASEIIQSSTRKTALTSFTTGLPSSIPLMAAAGTVDLVQYFGFALNLAQKIAYLFGEDEIFPKDVTEVGTILTDGMETKDGVEVPEEAQVRLISYLGAMLGVSGAASLILKTSKQAGAVIGKKVAAQALTKTVWYPIFKKVGSMLGYKITKKTVESIITKAVPLIGGVISGGITYVTFKPMGNRLADVFVKMINGEYDKEMELNPEFLRSLEKTHDTELEQDFIDVEFTEE